MGLTSPDGRGREGPLPDDDTAYVVIGGEIVLAAYRRESLAHRHSQRVTGTTVTAVDLSLLPPELRALIRAEILDELPASIVEDLQVDAWDESESTPEVVSVDELDDVKR